MHSPVFSSFNPTLLRASATLVAVALLLVVDDVSAYPCAHDPNSDCRGPEVGPWFYQVADGVGGLGQGRSQAQALAAYRQQALDAGFCTFDVTDQLPPRLPDPNVGNGSIGNPYDSLYLAQGTFYSWGSFFGSEHISQLIPFRVEGTKGASCQIQHGPHGASVQRHRNVDCPNGYSRVPWVDVCGRSNSSRLPRKNFGDECTIANPVNAATGNKFQKETDYQSSNSPLEFARYYNSLASWYSVADGTSNIGSNWRSSYDAAILFGGSVVYPTAYAYRPDGRRLDFDFVNGAFKADADVHVSLVATRNSAGEIIGWTYTDEESGVVETYDEYGLMSALATRSGLALTVSRDPRGRVVSVTDSFGKQLQFTYDANARVQTMTVRVVAFINTVTARLEILRR